MALKKESMKKQRSLLGRILCWLGLHNDDLVFPDVIKDFSATHSKEEYIASLTGVEECRRCGYRSGKTF